MRIRCVWEHNGPDTLLYAESLPGAFTRGATLDEAKAKMNAEIRGYRQWTCCGEIESFELEISQEKSSELCIRDADSDVIFDSERCTLSMGEYAGLKILVMKSAEDFQALYDSIPDKTVSCLPLRKTFYGDVPRTAEEMYRHTKNVNEYYFWEIGVNTDNEGSIAQCRTRGFEKLEQMPDFLTRPVCEGSYGEEWSLRKLLRRFLWHDRIHAKSMYRMAVKTFGENAVPNIFKFE